MLASGHVPKLPVKSMMGQGQGDWQPLHEAVPPADQLLGPDGPLQHEHTKQTDDSTAVAVVFHMSLCACYCCIRYLGAVCGTRTPPAISRHAGAA